MNPQQIGGFWYYFDIFQFISFFLLSVDLFPLNFIPQWSLTPGALTPVSAPQITATGSASAALRTASTVNARVTCSSTWSQRKSFESIVSIKALELLN